MICMRASYNFASLQIYMAVKNQRTNGPVNAHLTIGLNHKEQFCPCCKIGQGQTRVIIYIHFVHLKTLVGHA